jgi:outer membrane protein assembly factor BamE
MIIRLLFCTLILLFAGSSCGLIYKQNIQQGNAIEQDDLDELYIGMNRRQVLFVLGTPSIQDPFHHDRWDYVQTFSRRGGDMVQRTVTLRFEDDLLSDIIGMNDPFSLDGDDDGAASGGGTIASFSKSPDDAPESPQEAAIESAEEEVLNPEPDISTIDERNAEDREYQEDMDVLDQTPDGAVGGPDIDG